MKRIAIIMLFSIVILSGCQSPQNNPTAQKNTDVSDESLNDAKFEYSDTGSSATPVKGTVNFFAMDTLMTVTVYEKDKNTAEKNLSACLEEVTRLEKLFSTVLPDSDISLTNTHSESTVHRDTAKLLETALDFGKKTDQLFNIAIYPIVKEWGFTSDTFHVPEQNKLETLLPTTSLENIHFERNSNGTGHIHLKQGMAIDLGAIAKGYTSHKLTKILQEHHTPASMISLGGNVHVFGKKPDGKPFRIGIQNPSDPSSYVGIVTATDKAVITSGSYQRFFVEDNIHYHHIIDPRSGYPATSGLTSVTIISDDSTMADAYSTALFIMGIEKATDFWRTHTPSFEAIFIDDIGQVYVTEGLEHQYEPYNLPAPTIIRR